MPDHVARRPDLARHVDHRDLEVREVGDGNINLVFVARDGAGNGLCLKQALPYVRSFGEGWPLTPARVAAEARAYRTAERLDPGATPAVYDLDREQAVLGLEDLSGWTVWRSALNDGERHAGVAERLGRYVARVAHGTSPGSRPGVEFRREAAASINPDLCLITEDLVFSEPFEEHPHNSFDPALADEVARIRADQRALARVAELRHRFQTCGEALIHGDLHTGSVMVRRDRDGAARAKAFDAEFAFYGPVGFDLGALLANYLAARARGAALDRSATFRAYVDRLAGETIEAFWEETSLAGAEPRVGGWTERWLECVLADAVGFAAVKAIRRIVGWAKNSDIETLPPAAHAQAAACVLRTAHAWLLAPSAGLARDEAIELIGPLR